jgi:hypothetical protein
MLRELLSTNALNAGVVLTINSGGLLTNANFAIAYNGGSITSNSGELNAFVQQNTTTSTRSSPAISP